MAETSEMEVIRGGQRFIKMIVSIGDSFVVRRNLAEGWLPHRPFSHVALLDTNDALHFYHHENAETEGGLLKIKTERKENGYRAFNEKTKKFYNDKKYIQSAMLQGWNKFCFTGGIVEFRAKLPGSPRIGGLWPARE
jgi:beta-glucanase (GH16 family)